MGRRWDSVLACTVDDGRAGARLDSLTNEVLGYGTSRDKLGYGYFSCNAKLSDQELHALYYSDDISARIVNDRPAEMFRAGYALCADEPDKAKALQDKAKTLNLDTKVLRAWQRGRWYGGSLLVFGARDGAKYLTEPLNLSRVQDVTYLNVIDRRFATVKFYQENPFLPRFGEPEIYTISAGSSVVDIHASRVIHFDGVPETDETTRRVLGGWTYSCLQRPYDVLRKFATSFDGAAQLLADIGQAVWKVEGLIDAIANDESAVMTRMRLADMMRSAGRGIMVDAENEDFTRVTTPLAGVDAVLDRIVARLAAAANMPQTRLMGRSPAGMNATGESDERGWLATVACEQENELKPILLRCYEVIAGGKLPAGLDVEFHPLWEMTETEKATVKKTQADTHKVYVDMGAVQPAQVAIAEFGSGKGKIEIDEEALKADIEHENELLKNPEKRAEQEAAMAEVLNAGKPKDPEDGQPTEEPDAGEG